MHSASTLQILQSSSIKSLGSYRPIKTFSTLTYFKAILIVIPLNICSSLFDRRFMLCAFKKLRKQFT